jgi:hypothetical protein
MWLAAILITVLGVDIAWTCHVIRLEFAESGLRVERIRYLFLKRLFSLRWTNWHSLYRVWYSDRAGVSWSCLVVSTSFRGRTIEEQRQEPGPPGTRVPRARSAGVRAFPWLSAGSALLGSVAIGLPYWSVPYNQVNLPDGLIGVGLLLVAVLAGAVQYLEPRRWRSTLPILASAPVIAVIARVVFDFLRDPSSHNLFPIEVAIASFVGALTASAGMVAGWLLGRLSSSGAAPVARSRAPLRRERPRAGE